MRRAIVGARALVAVAILALLVGGIAQAVPPKKTPKLSITLTASAVDPTSGQYTLTVTGDGYGTPQAIWPNGHIHFTCGQQAGLLCNTDIFWRSAGVLQDPPLFETTVVCRSGDSSIQAFDDDNGVKSNKIKAPTC